MCATTTATAFCHRHDISDRVWELLSPHLPGGSGKVARPAQDNCRFSNAVFWLLRTGAPWRSLARPASGDGWLRCSPPVQALASKGRLGRTASRLD